MSYDRDPLLTPPGTSPKEDGILGGSGSNLPPTPPSTIPNSEAGSDYLGPISKVPEYSLQSKPSYALAPAPKKDQKVLPEDLKTPDKHVERDPRLIRLTGVHPFNVEAPLRDLYDEGFITTKDLHYVRNHGYVPEVQDSEVLDWEFSIEGMVRHPIKMTLRDLLEDYEQVTYPVTLVCAGNRRKEQNIVRKTKGFSWGAGGLSTALWTGVVLPELLGRAQPMRGAKYVAFEGADKLPNGYYGTSIKLNWAMDPNRGVLISHGMNGEALHPDHGKPLRVVIPGQIGGRSVKWLKRIIVMDKPSENWYHIYDNRVLPTTISPEASADLPEVWKDERYAIYDLNTNSATAYPADDETITVTANDTRTYNVRGYAYSGGGRRVTRMEVTLDKGKTWISANMRYPEDEYRMAPEGETLYGGRLDMSWRETSFCWCFWDVEIPLTQMAQADDIMVRGMDESMMVQPRDLYWSVLGMMNNPWFRIVIHKEPGGAHGSQILRFEHPTKPAIAPGGWMDRVKKAGGDLTNGWWGEKMAGDDSETQAPAEPVEEICMTNPDVKRIISLEELRQHESETEPWFVLHGEVFDGTPFLEGHPGGATSITNSAAQDATEEFMAIHSENAKRMMPKYHLGTLDPASRKALESGEDSSEEKAPREVFLQPKAWSSAILSGKEVVSDDTTVFSFRLDREDQAPGLPTGQHLLMRLRDPATREAIIRAYTPLSLESEKGFLRVLVKIYRATATMSGGKMTTALDSLPIGHPVDFRGPVGKLTYFGHGCGALSLRGQDIRARRMYMICAGSGVTPILQVLRAALQDGSHDDNVEANTAEIDSHPSCVVLDGNRNESDILCREELEVLHTAYPNRCRLVHTLTRPADGWTGRTGRVDKALLEAEIGQCRNAEIPAVDGEIPRKDLVLVCGPPALEASVKETLGGMGWGEDDLVFF